MSAVRPTPADPTPGLTSARGGGDQRAVPPEPGPDSLAVLSGSLGVRRPRLVADGFHERVTLASFRPEPVRMELRLAVAVDFADLFEVTSGVRHRRVADPLRRWAEERAHLRTDQATDRRLVVDPHIPPEIRRITVWRLRAFGRLWDLEAVGDAGYVRLAAG